MKKVFLIASVAMLSLNTTISAQGMFSKMKEKLAAAAMPKGSLYYYYEDIDNKEKAKELMFTDKVKIVDDSKITVKAGASEIIYQKLDQKELKQTVYMISDWHDIMMKLQDDYYVRFKFRGADCKKENLSIMEAFSGNKEIIKEIQKDDKCENYK